MKQLSDLTLNELFALDRNKTLVILPISGTDERGENIPLGFDTIKTEKMIHDFATEFLAQHSDFQILITPTLHASVDSVNTRYAFHFRPHVVRDWVVDQVKNLNQLGFRYFISVTGTLTPKNLTALEDAEKILSGGFGLYFKKSTPKYASLSSASIPKSLSLVQMLFPDYSEHGYTQDLQFLKMRSPETLKSTSETVGSVNSQFTTTAWGRFKQWYFGKNMGAWKREGVTQQPIYPNTEWAKKQSEIISRWLDDQTDRSTFRSWYSVIPQNKSFAKSWLITAAIFIIFIMALTIGF